MKNKGIPILINDFNKFIDTNIEPSIRELQNITSNTNRSHLQRLVYTNLVDRFDSLIDLLLIECASEKSAFNDKIMSSMKDTPIDKRYLFSILLSNDIAEVVKEELEGIVKNGFLRKRHSLKLRTLLFDCFDFASNEIDKPRVNADGRIHSTYKQSTAAKKKIPATIIGYADWVYSRRNTLVHNFGKLNLNQHDFDYIKSNFGTTPSKSVGIKIESITSLKKFYKYLMSEITDKLDAREGLSKISQE